MNFESSINESKLVSGHLQGSHKAVVLMMRLERDQHMLPERTGSYFLLLGYSLTTGIGIISARQPGFSVCITDQPCPSKPNVSAG